MLGAGEAVFSKYRHNTCSHGVYGLVGEIAVNNTHLYLLRSRVAMGSGGK